jgi:hypothetical protein
MEKKHLLIGAGFGALALAILVVVLVLQPQGSAPSATEKRPVSPVAQPDTAGREYNAALAFSPTSPPPWKAQGTTAAPATAQDDAAKEASMQQIQRRLQVLTAGGKQVDPVALDGILADLMRTQNSSQVGGVDLAVLRDTLARSQKISKLAQEMQQLAQQPNVSADKIQAKVAEIQKLQAGINPNILVTPANGKP